MSYRIFGELFKRSNYWSYFDIRASSKSREGFESNLAINFDSCNGYWTPSGKQSEGEWLQVCFYNHRAKISKYYLKTCKHSSKPAHWNMSVSNDNKTFINEKSIDHPLQNNEEYEVNYVTNKAYQCFRITTTGQSTAGTNYFDLYQLELFGVLYPYNNNKQDSFQSKKYFPIFKILTFIPIFVSY